MNSVALYNLDPILHVMIMGLVVASGPLAWIWLRNRQATTSRRLQALTVLTLFLTFDLVMFGAFTRLTDSGLGCPDWPGCYGSASPVGAHAHITAAEQAMPTGPVTRGKAWIEMIHRYLATGVGVLSLVLALFSWVEWRRAQREGGRAANPWWATWTLIAVSVQGAFGALTVTMKLFPAIVTLHLIGGLAVLVLLCLQAVHYGQLHDNTVIRPLARKLRGGLWLGMAALSLQVVLGGWVSTNYAVLACTDFPTCQGSWWPPMNFDQGFSFWHALGMTAQGEVMEFAALTAIHYVHRLAAYAVLAVLAVLAWRLHALAAWRRMARGLGGLLALQLATGLSNVVLDWPLLAAVLHTGGAAAMVVLLTWGLVSSAPTESTTTA